MDTGKIIKAFPKFLTVEVSSLLNKVSLKSEYQISDTFEVVINSEKLEIPCRIYFEEPNEKQLTETELLILNCLFTRHHDGFVRQQRLEKVLLSNEYWITPFIMRLLGEYLIEILDVIEKNLSDEWVDNLTCFIEENNSFFETTKRRINSYWNCYYRNKFYIKEDYVGFRILTRLEKNTEKERKISL
jgi:hypothetical protein